MRTGVGHHPVAIAKRRAVAPPGVDGTFVVVWARDEFYANTEGVAGQVLDSDGSKLGDEVEHVLFFLSEVLYRAVPALHDRSTLAAGLTAALVSVLVFHLPLNFGLIVAAGSGILAGLLVE